MANDKVDVFIPIYIGDYHGDTQDLHAEEHGAYLLILFTMWKTRAPIQFDRMASIARVTPERWPDVWGTIKRFFDVSAGMVTQGRLMRELDASLEKKRRKSDAGTKSGESRRRTKGEQDANRTGIGEPTEGEPSTSPSEDPECVVSDPTELFPVSKPPERTPARSEGNAKEPAGVDYPREFELAWASTARTGSKFKAFESWKRLGRPAAEVLSASWGDWSRLDGWQRGFVPHVVTWLNGRCWEQSPSEVRRAATGPPSRSDGNEDALRDWLERNGEATG